MSGHTPGPWPINFTGDGKRIVVGEGLVEGPNGYEVAEVYSDDCPQEIAAANAHLIAAAPELLEALVDASERLRTCARLTGTGAEFIGQMMKPFEAAIAKARGDAA